MKQPKSHAEFVFQHLTSTIAEQGQAEGHPHHAGAHPDRRGAIGHDLESVRSRLDEVIASCVHRESVGDVVESGDNWQFAPHHLTTIDSLKRLRQKVDSLATRVRSTVPPREGHGEADRWCWLDRAVAEAAAAMVQRFEASGSEHDLQANLQHDLRQLEHLLDERALLGHDS